MQRSRSYFTYMNLSCSLLSIWHKTHPYVLRSSSPSVSTRTPSRTLLTLMMGVRLSTRFCRPPPDTVNLHSAGSRAFQRATLCDWTRTPLNDERRQYGPTACRYRQTARCWNEQIDAPLAITTSGMCVVHPIFKQRLVSDRWRVFCTASRTKTGAYKDQRDTERRCARHKDGCGC